MFKFKSFWEIVEANLLNDNTISLTLLNSEKKIVLLTNKVFSNFN